MTEPLHILFLASEAAPFIKVGGLGDVAGALPPAIRALPEKPDIRLVIPLYPARGSATEYKLQPVVAYDIPHKDGPIKARAFETKLGDLPVYFIGGAPLVVDGPIYSADTLADGHKFTFFSLAALELAKHLGWHVDILHAQDWHTAPAVYALKTLYKDDPFYANTATLLTVHNLPYLGNDAGPAMDAFGLPPATDSTLPTWAQDMALPVGLQAADKINTVSTGYAQEMLTKEFGANLQKYLKTRKDDLLGIVNGIDQDAWNPLTDTALAANFGPDTLADRQKNKMALLKEMELTEDPNLPLLAFIGRMDYQKGIEIALAALRKIKDLPWQAVILGTGDEKIEALARQLAEEMPDKVRAVIRFDGALARRMYAGADMMMVPSRYEPCGLIQMIAMRYGCVPVARATGGLKDTITDHKNGADSTGFLFKKAAPNSMAKALRRALNTYADQAEWQAIQRRDMAQDFSWAQSAAKYMALYQALL